MKQTKYLETYCPPDYLIKEVDLDFNLKETCTLVKTNLKIYRNPKVQTNIPVLRLDGRDLELVSILMDGQPLAEDCFRLDHESMSILNPPEVLTLCITTRLNPATNTSLEGLYFTSDIFCTQCEAQGFQKITYFIDRPDVMAHYTCKITADHRKYPILLSNGNLIAAGRLDHGRHWVQWQDPFFKPSYLFALVAGDLVCVEDVFQTCSGRRIELKIYVQPGNADKCDHALQALQKAMLWDEQVYGREYDLDVYMITAVDDFNMGAMENKGLNVFNSAYVLAQPETATDDDFQKIETIIAHEYFHNWTGNRITLRDWFQLSLKEGLTVFRDQQFTEQAVMGAIKRIDDVRNLRTSQFQEDGGPLSHPVRPESYLEINNFYTTTVYNKGAEIIRMLYLLQGSKKFYQVMELYFERFDGMAVTIDQFLDLFEKVMAFDLHCFRRWYSQAGTPIVRVKYKYDAVKGEYWLNFRQECPDCMHIPIAVGLVDQHGKDIPLCLQGESDQNIKKTTRILHLCTQEASFTFINIDARQHGQLRPSILRGFSAPVKLKIDLNDTDLSFLMAHDTDAFNCWDAGHRLFATSILKIVHDLKNQKALKFNPDIMDAFKQTLLNQSRDQALIAELLTLPSENVLGQMIFDQGHAIDPDTIHAAREFVLQHLSLVLKDELMQVYTSLKDPQPYRPDPQACALRRLKYLVLFYLGKLSNMDTFIYQEFCQARHMTAEISTLKILANQGNPLGNKALQKFYLKWRHDPIVLNKWFSIQASTHTLKKVEELMQGQDFSIKNPNKVRALIGRFCFGNPWHFHQKDGAGYKFLARQVLRLDRLNPQMAASMVEAFNHWKKYDDFRRQLIQTELHKILMYKKLSSNVFEIVSKAVR